MPISGYFFARFAPLACLLESVQVKDHLHVCEFQPYSQMM